jgi:hypothetical protein
MKIISVFGNYAGAMQVIIDENLARFSKPWFLQYFPWDTQSTSLTFTDVVGASRIEAAASVVNRSSKSPQRTRNFIAKFMGEIPAMKEKVIMREEDYRDFLQIQNSMMDDVSKKNALLDLLFKDVNMVATAGEKRVDLFALEGLSTGYINVNTTNNPDGIVLKTQIDLLLPSGNRKVATADWSNPVTAKPISDFVAVRQYALNTKGAAPKKCLMTPTQFLMFSETQQVINSLTAYNQLQTGASLVTLDRVNEYLQKALLPIIELVDVAIGIEKDGAITTVNPWSAANVAFVPDGSLGVTKNSFAMEQMKPVEQVKYATYGRTLISKWQNNDPWEEATGMELNAMPSFASSIDNVYLLTIDL